MVRRYSDLDFSRFNCVPITSAAASFSTKNEDSKLVISVYVLAIPHFRHERIIPGSLIDKTNMSNPLWNIVMAADVAVKSKSKGMRWQNFKKSLKMKSSHCSFTNEQELFCIIDRIPCRDKSRTSTLFHAQQYTPNGLENVDQDVHNRAKIWKSLIHNNF